MEEHLFLLYGIIKKITENMKTEELINIANKIDDILYEHGYVVDHDILAHHIFRVIKESYPNDNIELEPPDLKIGSGLKYIPEIV